MATDLSYLLKASNLIFQDTTSYPLPGKIVPCLLCEKPFLMRKFIGEPDQICPECWNTYKDTARIICKVCKVTICRVKPKLLDNGFYVRPRMVLHSNACNVCKPGLKTSTIEEIALYEKMTTPKKIIIVGNKHK